MYIPNRENPIRWPSMTANTHRLALDAGLLLDLLHRHLGRRVADVGPSGRVQPDARVGPLHEQQLAAVVADDGADRHLRGDVAGHAFADVLQPLLHEVVGLAATSASSSSSAAAALMSAATWSTSSNRSRSYRFSVKPSRCGRSPRASRSTVRDHGDRDHGCATCRSYCTPAIADTGPALPEPHCRRTVTRSRRGGRPARSRRGGTGR
jgi:hypothetical protein